MTAKSIDQFNYIFTVLRSPKLDGVDLARHKFSPVANVDYRILEEQALKAISEKQKLLQGHVDNLEKLKSKITLKS